MDRLWLLTEAMEALIEDCQRFADDLQSDILNRNFSDNDLVVQRCRDLAKALRQYIKQLEQMHSKCIEGVAFLRKHKHTTGGIHGNHVKPKSIADFLGESDQAENPNC